jgi:septum formation protein
VPESNYNQIELILASKSPRRAELLRDAGLMFSQRTPLFDDPAQPVDHPEPVAHAMDLAKQKALSLADEMQVGGVASPVLLIAADTICVGVDGALIGQPRDKAHAREMIRSFAAATHDVVTGVALMVVDSQRSGGLSQIGNNEVEQLAVFSDVVPVTFGKLGTDELERYLVSDQWQGKAGGYNLFDRQEAGWPISLPEDSDPTTVVGLPMRILMKQLARLGIDANCAKDSM